MNLQPKSEAHAQVFDRGVLLRQSMNDLGLANEVLGLFLAQLDALSRKEWSKLDLHFEMHTLKGSAATVGALELEALARDWREIGPELQTRVMAAIKSFQGAAK